MNQHEVELITNTLSNIYDWKSSDIRSDFSSFISKSTSLSLEQACAIFDRFEKTPLLERESINFNYNSLLD